MTCVEYFYGIGLTCSLQSHLEAKNVLFKAKTERHQREEEFSKQVHKLADAGIRADILEDNMEMIKPGPDPIKIF